MGTGGAEDLILAAWAYSLVLLSITWETLLGCIFSASSWGLQCVPPALDAVHVGSASLQLLCSPGSPGMVDTTLLRNKYLRIYIPLLSLGHPSAITD